MSVQVALSILTLPFKPRVDRSAHNIAAFIIAVFLFFPVLSFDVGCGHGGDDLVRHGCAKVVQTMVGEEVVRASD